jgi:Amt family ammonium transporter
LLVQLIGVLATWALAAGMTFLILKVVAVFTPLRVTEEEEIAGLDLVLHGEVAYNFLSPGMGGSVRLPSRAEAAFGSAQAEEPSPGD